MLWCNEIINVLLLFILNVYLYMIVFISMYKILALIRLHYNHTFVLVIRNKNEH